MKKHNDTKEEKGRLRLLFGWIVIIIGAGLLLENMFSWFKFGYVWPLAIVAVGVYLIQRRPK